MNLNKVFIIGRLTADPQLRSTAGGQSVVSMGIATNRVWTDKTGNKREETEFHTVIAWGRQAEIANQFLAKGSLMFVEGRLQTRAWQDKQGQQRKTTEIVCERLQLGPRPQGGGEARTTRAPEASSSGSGKSEEVPREEEIPVVDLDEQSKPEDLPF